MNAYRASVEDDFVCNFRYEARMELRMGWPHKEISGNRKSAKPARQIEY